MDFGDGTVESFFLTPGEHGYNPEAKSFVIQHKYGTVLTFMVRVRVIDSGDALGASSFPVAVFTAREASRIVGFAIGIVDESGTAQSELAAVDGATRLTATIVNGKPGDNISLSLFNSDPVPDRIASEDIGPVTRIPTEGDGDGAGSTVPLVFVDTRVIAGNQVEVTLVYEFVLPDAVAQRDLRLFWWNKKLKIWQNVSGQADGGDSIEVTPILDALGNRTGKSLVRLTKVYGPNSSPSIAQLTGTVFSIAVPVNNGSPSTFIVLPTTLASSSQTDFSAITARTTGLGGRSNFALSVQELQTGPLSGPSNRDLGGVGERDSTSSEFGEEQLLNWLLEGELWRERRQFPPRDQQPGAPANQQPQQGSSGNGGGKQVQAAAKKARFGEKHCPPKRSQARLLRDFSPRPKVSTRSRNGP